MGIPIITPTTVMIGWVSEISFAIIKRSTLSILVIITKPKSRIPNPEVSFPFANSIIAAGINTIGAPIAGRKLRNVAITPQNIGSLIPKRKKHILSREPCTTAI
jgi:energy-converting hydrogenase Eha subunit A